MNGPCRLLVRALTALLLVSAGPTLAAEPSGTAPVAPLVQAETAPGGEDAKQQAAPSASPLPPKADATAGTLNEEPLNAEDPFAEDPALAGAEDESLLWTLVRTLLVLGVVIACIYVVLNFGLRRMMGLKPGAQGTHALVTVVERIPLDPKHTLLVLKAAGEYLLVGTGDGGMNLIAKLQTEEVERLQRDRMESAGAMSPFLQKLLSRGGHPPPSA